MKYIQTSLIGFALIILISCTKFTSDEKEANNLLSGSPWLLQKDEVKNGNGLWEDQFPSWEACKKDDKWMFRSDFRLAIDEAADACTGRAPNEIQIEWSWSLSENGSVLNCDGIMDKSERFIIEHLDKDRLVLFYSDNSGMPLQERLTFVH